MNRRLGLGATYNDEENVVASHIGSHGARIPLVGREGVSEQWLVYDGVRYIYEVSH